MALTTSRNAPCSCGAKKPTGEAVKYKNCCLAKDEAARKPHTGEDAVIVLMPSRGAVTYETSLALSNNLRDTKHIIASIGRKPIVEARNELAKQALMIRDANPFEFTPREWFVLFVDDDAWWAPGTVGVMLNAMRDRRDIDALFGWFSTRNAFQKPVAFTDAENPNSHPQPGVNCKPGDLVRIEAAGLHFCLARLSLLERLGENPFDISEGSTMGEDWEFCQRAVAAGAHLAVGTGMPIVHIDQRDGAAYMVGMPAGQMRENSVGTVSLAHSLPDGTVKRGELRSYGMPEQEEIARQETARIEAQYSRGAA